MPPAIRHLDKTGGTIITGQNWPDAIAGQTQTPAKFGIQNVGDRALTNLIASLVAFGSSDGNSMARVALDTTTLSCPYGCSISVGGSGGVYSSTGTYYYVVTATNASGETTMSLEMTAVITATTQKATLLWTLPAGATGIKVYRTTTSGSYGATSLRATLGAVSTYVDDGAALSAGTPATANTTGGAAPNYGGDASTTGLGPITIGNLAIGQQAFYRVGRVVGSGTSEAGNPRTFSVRFAES